MERAEKFQVPNQWIELLPAETSPVAHTWNTHTHLQTYAPLTGRGVQVSVGPPCHWAVLNWHLIAVWCLSLWVHSCLCVCRCECVWEIGVVMQLSCLLWSPLTLSQTTCHCNSSTCAVRRADTSIKDIFFDSFQSPVALNSFLMFCPVSLRHWFTNSLQLVWCLFRTG